MAGSLQRQAAKRGRIIIVDPRKGVFFYASVRRAGKRQSRSEKRKRRKEKHRQRRIAAFIHFGEKCADCGLKSSSENYIAFDFHHLKPRDKETELSDAHDISDARFWAEIKKCVLLCSNCHRIRHWDKRIT